MQSAQTITEYIGLFSGKEHERLVQVYTTLKQVLPNATETIKYGMPTFVGNKNLVHFAAMKHHIGFYPGPQAITAHSKQLAPYVTSKGAIQFPYTMPLPLQLIAEIAQYRLQQDSRL